MGSDLIGPLRPCGAWHWHLGPVPQAHSRLRIRIRMRGMRTRASNANSAMTARTLGPDQEQRKSPAGFLDPARRHWRGCAGRSSRRRKAACGVPGPGAKGAASRGRMRRAGAGWACAAGASPKPDPPSVHRAQGRPLHSGAETKPACIAALTWRWWCQWQRSRPSL